jgi:hypothetical protein
MFAVVERTQGCVDASIITGESLASPTFTTTITISISTSTSTSTSTSISTSIVACRRVLRRRVVGCPTEHETPSAATLCFGHLHCTHWIAHSPITS